jgi:hypothetical protein
MKQGVRLNPYYPEGYNNLASFWIQKKDYEMAEGRSTPHLHYDLITVKHILIWGVWHWLRVIMKRPGSHLEKLALRRSR